MLAQQYRGAIVATCEVVWLKRLLKNFNKLVNKLILIHCDNLSSIHLAKILVFHALTKHIEMHYHYIHECIFARDIDLQYISTNEQVADIFTKLGLVKLWQFSMDLGLRPLIKGWNGQDSICLAVGSLMYALVATPPGIAFEWLASIWQTLEKSIGKK